ncbi:MAG: cytochrome c family protein [Erythrobacter sp.]
MADKDTQDAAPVVDDGSGDLFNTAAGWVLFAAGLGLGLSILANMYFHGSDAERPEQFGYTIEGVEVEGGGGEQMTMAEALTLVSASDGERVFAKCSACHSIDAGGANGVGPNLHGIMGANVAAVSGYSYSGALSSFGGQWGWDEMNEWLANPRGYVDGTKMGFAGLSSLEDRAAVALYMNEQGSGIPLPEFVPPAPEEDAEVGDGDDTEAGGSGMVTESELEDQDANPEADDSTPSL